MVLDELIGMSVKFPSFEHEGEMVQIFETRKLMQLLEHYSIRVNETLNKQFYKKKNKNYIIGHLSNGSITLCTTKLEEDNYLIIECSNEELLTSDEYKLTEALAVGYLI